ncbi:MAG: GAF domain-containing protein [Ignavibacteriae bacterium]|nr:GAF domain-containing protein [Ignavibacteriota bacterium]
MYEELLAEIESLVIDEKNFVANASNFVSHLYSKLENISWIGFYLLSGDVLLIGPYQGKPACVRLHKNMGVCWASVNKREVVRVDNVHEFPTHIVCDAEANSELVIPLIKNGVIYGVLDLDSYLLNRFTEEDSSNLKKLVDTLVNASDMQAIGRFYGKTY